MRSFCRYINYFISIHRTLQTLCDSFAKLQFVMCVVTISLLVYSAAYVNIKLRNGKINIHINSTIIKTISLVYKIITDRVIEIKMLMTKSV
jgi:hypothetical protein